MIMSVSNWRTKQEKRKIKSREKNLKMFAKGMYSQIKKMLKLDYKVHVLTRSDNDKLYHKYLRDDDFFWPGSIIEPRIHDRMNVLNNPYLIKILKKYHEKGWQFGFSVSMPAHEYIDYCTYTFFVYPDKSELAGELKRVKNDNYDLFIFGPGGALDDHMNNLYEWAKVDVITDKNEIAYSFIDYEKEFQGD